MGSTLGRPLWGTNLGEALLGDHYWGTTFGGTGEEDHRKATNPKINRPQVSLLINICKSAAPGTHGRDALLQILIGLL